MLYADNPTVKKVGFSVRYKNGWFAHTDFSEDLSVSGAHISGGEKVFVHMVEDKASKELWELLSNSALKIIKKPSMDLNPDPDPVYAITITLSDGTNLFYERELEKKYDDINLNGLSNIIGKNQRIYIHQKGKPWILK